MYYSKISRTLISAKGNFGFSAAKLYTHMYMHICNGVKSIHCPITFCDLLAIADHVNFNVYIAFISYGYVYVNLSVACHRKPHVVRVGTPGRLAVGMNCEVFCICLVVLLGVNLDVRSLVWATCSDSIHKYVNLFLLACCLASLKFWLVHRRCGDASACIKFLHSCLAINHMTSYQLIHIL